MKKKLLFLLCLFYSHYAMATELTISAAVSLREAFGELIKVYQQKNPQIQLHLNTGGSGLLLQQIDKGAPVDIFASADTHTMEKAKSKHLVDKKNIFIFASNQLVLASSNDSKLKMTQLKDLSKDNIQRIALSNPNIVPAGRYGKIALQGASLWEGLQNKIIRTRDVRQSLDYIARKEVDIGFVYRTDATIMSDKVKILFPVELPEPVLYPIAVLNKSQLPEEAQQFVQFVLSESGQIILKKYGFQEAKK